MWMCSCRAARPDVLYLLDANVLIRAHADYYALDRVPQFWHWLVHHAAGGRVKMPQEIFEEVAGGGAPRDGDLLLPFLRRQDVRRALILDEEPNTQRLEQVLTQAYGGPLPTEADLERMGQDPFLVAYALADPARRCVVTCEASKPGQIGPRRHVPNACTDVGVRALTPFEFVRALDFTVDWRARLAPTAP
jgi:hypothetical protein